MILYGLNLWEVLGSWNGFLDISVRHFFEIEIYRKSSIHTKNRGLANIYSEKFF
ncbi:hypothetical protein HanXRQr2_CPg0835881 (chloroplast) [Helianthus annuus]|uniref:Uncharacterized protein n=1 Tax=Helianthus annuus TaxID=4232 RepID=A0A9K3DFU2_HELAN|nr:hypothetical protein HanXRQr2_CPg0835881 [Helianthus annuus]KAJ0959511.1 hypothetical protein HanPSC8_Chr00c054g0803411 [Helianthus annuus]